MFVCLIFILSQSFDYYFILMVFICWNIFNIWLITYEWFSLMDHINIMYNFWHCIFRYLCDGIARNLLCKISVLKKVSRFNIGVRVSRWRCWLTVFSNYFFFFCEDNPIHVMNILFRLISMREIPIIQTSVDWSNNQ